MKVDEENLAKKLIYRFVISPNECCSFSPVQKLIIIMIISLLLLISFLFLSTKTCFKGNMEIMGQISTNENKSKTSLTLRFLATIPGKNSQIWRTYLQLYTNFCFLMILSVINEVPSSALNASRAQVSQVTKCLSFFKCQSAQVSQVLQVSERPRVPQVPRCPVV